MSWPEYAIWWQVHPLGFIGAEAAARAADAPMAHRLPHLEAWLDYAVDLGCSGLALGPIFASATHGYDTVDHFRIDPRLGDDGDFDSLVTAAHGRGLRVLLDGVFNHVGRGFPRFAEALAAGPGSPAARWFRFHWPEGGGEPDYDTFEGHGQLAALNHDEPAVADYVVDVMRHWLDRGADGWRLDAAYAVPPGFWQAVLPRVRAEHPRAWFAGEMIHGDYSAYVRASGLDSVTQYELWKAIWSSLNDGNFFELAWALDRHNAFADTFLPLTFVGNHDVTRLASKLDEPEHFGHALAVLFAVAGTPSIYYGDEQAFRGEKEDRQGGDDAVRPPFPGTPEELAPWGWPTYRLHQRLIGLRRRHPWLARARTHTLHVTNRTLALRAEPATDSDRCVVLLLNVDDEPYRFPPEAPELPIAATSDPSSRPDDPLQVPPHSWTILAAD